MDSTVTRWLAVGGALAGVAVVGVCLGSVAYGAVATDASHPASETGSMDVAAMAQRLTDAERAAVAGGMPADQQLGTEDMLDQLASGRIAVTGLVDGVAVKGWASTEMLSATSYPDSLDDLWPVTSDDGTIIGYIGPGVSMIPAADVAAAATAADESALLEGHSVIARGD